MPHALLLNLFFIDNDNDLASAQEDIDGLAGTYTRAIDQISEEAI